LRYRLIIAFTISIEVKVFLGKRKILEITANTRTHNIGKYFYWVIPVSNQAIPINKKATHIKGMAKFILQKKIIQ
jgi:hypothetical protein